MNDNGIKNHLGEIAGQLFPTWPTVVATLLALIVLLVVLTKLFYKPVKTMYQKRQQYVQNNIDESKRQLIGANQERENASDELLIARNRAKAIIDEANKFADQIKMNSIADAKVLAENIKNQTQLSIDQEKQNFYNDSKKIVADLAIKIAAKIVEKEINPQKHRKLITDFIEKDQNHDSTN